MKIDSHQHFWIYDPVRDSWITDEMKVIRRDFLPNDLEPLLRANDIDGCVAVQADQSLDQNDFLLLHSDQNDFIKAVVGWVDLRSDEVEKQIENYASHTKFVGVRHILQGEPSGFMLDKKFLGGIGKLKHYHLTYDILIFPNQLDEAIEFVKHFPDQPFVIDHLAKPPYSDGITTHWKKAMSALASFQNVSCKISGMVTETRNFQWQHEDFHPFIDHLLESFGPKRLMYGSDWPVCLVGGNYSEIYKIAHNYFSKLSSDEYEDIMGNNALEFYKIKNTHA